MLATPSMNSNTSLNRRLLSASEHMPRKDSEQIAGRILSHDFVERRRLYPFLAALDTEMLWG
jgi:hypothetical protein